MEFPLPENGIRYFQHFKGGHYRYVRTVFDSETKERMVIYQALYGDKQYWVRLKRCSLRRSHVMVARFQDSQNWTKSQDLNR